jgi:hypothetical protein
LVFAVFVKKKKKKILFVSDSFLSKEKKKEIIVQREELHVGRESDRSLIVAVEPGG